MPWILLFLFLLALPSPGSAYFDEDWEIKPHYLAEEAFFDLLAYQYPADWEQRFTAQRNGLRSTVGSISMEDFYQHLEVHLAQDLGSDLDFGYHYEETSLYKPTRPSQEAYLAWGRPWRFDLLGFPSQDKSQGDLGWAVGYGRRHETKYFRASRLYQNALYNEKRKTDEVSAVLDEAVVTPVTDRVEWVWREEGGYFLAGEAIWEHRAEHRWLEPELTRSHQAQKLRLRGEWGGEQALGIKAISDRQRRTQVSAEQERTAQDLGFYWLEAYGRTTLLEKLQIQLGSQRGRFENQITADRAADRYQNKLDSAQLYGQIRYRSSAHSEWFTSLQAGPSHLVKRFDDSNNDIDSQTTQLKASLGYLLSKLDRWQLYLNSTWDLDVIHYRQWDGGNLMVQMFF
ncbi:MAG: hypothetical protein RRB13_07415 [bacterium]|nr:hypothetical protein [bacterium]